MTIASAVSTAGTWMQLIAQNWLVLQLTGSGMLLGMMVTVQSVATLCLSPLGGSLADRFARKRILLFTQCAFAVLAASQAALAASDLLSAQLLFIIAAATGVTAAIDGPASNAFGADIVPNSHLSNAIAIGSISHSVGRIAGIAAAGVLIGLMGPAAAFAINAASFVPVALVIASISIPAPPISENGSQSKAKRPGLREVVETVRTQRLLPLFALLFMFGSLGRNYQVTMALMAKDVFGAGAQVYGWMSSAFAAGAIVGGLVAAKLGANSRTMLLAVCGTAATLQIVSGIVPDSTSFIVTLLPIAALAIVIDTIGQTITQLSAARGLRGRISSMFLTVGALASAFGGWALGAIADFGGARASLVTGGLVCLATVAILGVNIVRRQPAIEPAAVPASTYIKMGSSSALSQHREVRTS